MRVRNVPMEMPDSSSRSVPRWVLRGRRKNTNTLVELSLVLDINYSELGEGLLRYIKQAVADEGQLPADSTELGLLPLERFTQLEIPVSDFQETEVSQIHRAHCTRKIPFRRTGPEYDWV